MKVSRILAMTAKDLRRGPRLSGFLYALLMPFLMTFFVQVVLMTILDPVPRLGIADLGRSEIASAVGEAEGIESVDAGSAAELKGLVESHDVDAGLVLVENFDTAVRTGQRPKLDFHVSGESLMYNRILLLFRVLDLVREVEGKPSPADIEIEQLGEKKSWSIKEFVLLSLLLFALIITGIFVPGTLLVQEREYRTLEAVLVTPTTMFEVLISKGLFGFAMCVVVCLLTLALNGMLSAELPALLAALAVAALICNEIGLIYGTIARNAKSLYNMMQIFNVIVLGPVFFYLFPSMPQWPIKLFPSYYFIDPLYQIALHGASFSDVRNDLLIALGVGAVLFVLIVPLGRRMQAGLAAE